MHLISTKLLLTLVRAVVPLALALNLYSLSANELPSFEELAVIRAKAHQDRFKTYVLKKLEVHSYVQNSRGMCFDFIGVSDGLYRSFFDGGPIMVDMANCGEEDDFIDGRIKALQILDARERRDGLSVEQIDQVIEQINEIYKDKLYDSEIK